MVAPRESLVSHQIGTRASPLSLSVVFQALLLVQASSRRPHHHPSVHPPAVILAFGLCAAVLVLLAFLLVSSLSFLCTVYASTVHSPSSLASNSLYTRINRGSRSLQVDIDRPSKSLVPKEPLRSYPCHSLPNLRRALEVQNTLQGRPILGLGHIYLLYTPPCAVRCDSCRLLHTYAHNRNVIASAWT